MNEYISSKTMKTWLKEIGRVFSDFEKASIIYHSNKSHNEKTKALQLLFDTTEDENLRKQLKERIEYDKECRRLFWDEPEGFVYKLTNYEGEVEGYYSKPMLAFQKGKELKGVFILQQYVLLSDDNISENMNKRLGEKYSLFGCPVSSFCFDIEGEEIEFETELRPDCKITSTLYDNERFEYNCPEFPIPFDKGDIVREVRTRKRMTVLTSREEWDKYMKEGRRDSAHPYNLDGKIKVETPGYNNGIVTYITPFALEKTSAANDGKFHKKLSEYMDLSDDCFNDEERQNAAKLWDILCTIEPFTKKEAREAQECFNNSIIDLIEFSLECMHMTEDAYEGLEEFIDEVIGNDTHCPIYTDMLVDYFTELKGERRFIRVQE